MNLPPKSKSETEYRDVIGEVMQSNIAFKAHGLVLDGRWWT